MINNVWLYLIAIMLGGSILKNLLPNPAAWVVIDLCVFGVCWGLVRRYPYVDMRRTLLLLGALTAISVVSDLGLISGLAANIIVLAIIGWMIFGGRTGFGDRRPKFRHKWHK